MLFFGKNGNRKKVIHPGSFFIRAIILLLMSWYLLLWLLGLFTVSGDQCYSKPTFQDQALLRAIKARLANGEDDTMQLIFPEGKLFSNTFYLFALINISSKPISPVNGLFTFKQPPSCSG